MALTKTETGNKNENEGVMVDFHDWLAAKTSKNK